MIVNNNSFTLFLIISLFMLGPFLSKAQIPTLYYEEDQAIEYVCTPEEAYLIDVPAIDITPYQIEDIELDNGNNPYRFGVPIEVSLDLVELSNFYYVGEYKIWKSAISSVEAKSINIIFDDLFLPEGAAIYIFNESGREVQGPITPEMISEGGGLGSSVFTGEKIIIECAVPISAAIEPNLFVSKVIYGYRDFDPNEGGYGEAAECHVDVDCPEGDDWCVQKRAVTRLLINGNAHCSGAAINNAASDLNHPYILTAFHCVDDPNEDPATMQFQFHFKNASCGATSFNGLTFSFTGATLRAGWSWIGGATDFGLLELNTYDPDDNLDRLTGIHFAGWSRAAATPSESTLLHHPMGDAMKISIDNDGPVLFTLAPTQPDAYWQSDFQVGTAEDGSSGAPLFDEHQRIIGQHSFKNDGLACDVKNGFAGRLSVSWNGGGTSATRLSDWLGPVVGNTVDAYCAPIIFHNEQVSGNAGLRTATHDMEIEGMVTYPFLWFNSVIPISNQPFNILSGATAAYQAGRSITILPGVHIDKGSSVHAFIEDVSCNDGLDYHYAVKPNELLEAKRQKKEEDKLTAEVSMSTKMSFKVYPNPTTASVNIDLMGAKVNVVKVLNLQGKTLVYLPFDNINITEPITIGVADWPSGTYVIAAYLHDGTIMNSRFVKE